ncbi:MAG TPA: F0F1 ATP synthase subunit alpha, partial [Alcanivorax sp.]|nr:F0F1 ATP synthase subunit alpha [Alcanivorax sp.]
AQFASDLDDSTREQLEHGQAVTELMKQKQYSPMSVAEMGVVLYAANEGYLKGMEVEKIGAFEAALLDYMNSEKKALMDKINEKGDYNGEIEAEIKESLDQFKATQTW